MDLSSPDIAALVSEFGEKPPADVLAVKEADLVERRPREVPNRRVVEAATVEAEAPEVRIRREKRPQQVQRGRDLLKP